jgi:dihydroorotase
MKTVLKNFRIVDEDTDRVGSLIIEEGIIKTIYFDDEDFSDYYLEREALNAGVVIDGLGMAFGDTVPDEGWRERLPVLTPAFVDLHAHFRDPCVPRKETPFPAEVIESASLAAAAGGYGTVICMANSNPVTDTFEQAAAIKTRADALGLIDLYPAMSLTRGMEGRELSGITALPSSGRGEVVRLLSEDGKDVRDEALFKSAMRDAARIGVPVSCHCDFGGEEAEISKKRGESRAVWSRIEENNATQRAIRLADDQAVRLHIAHVSTEEAIEMIRVEKRAGRVRLTCEATPHNLCFTEARAEELGAESYGRVNPPLRTEKDRMSLIDAIADGTIDAIATDHAPHRMEDKARGSAGFSGLETAFAASYTELVLKGVIDLRRLSALMSANPTRILGLESSRGHIKTGYRADFAIIDLSTKWRVDPGRLKTRGKNSAFTGLYLTGKILATLHGGRYVF